MYENIIIIIQKIVKRMIILYLYRIATQLNYNEDN